MMKASRDFHERKFIASWLQNVECKDILLTSSCAVKTELMFQSFQQESTADSAAKARNAKSENEGNINVGRDIL